ncbi:hypothetical protein [Bacteroides sp.]|mgnify:FL=1|uniref:hypothetical protein n=1 Tax=Bacteroides sp. TaxID=29523 RepID=UPI002590B80E|nr:hypothetical protein [Bacteroides sp.]MCS3209937.1 hypothetical protein [Bacteroides stercoris]
MRMLRATYFSTVDDGLASYRSRLFKGIYMGTKVAVKRAVDEEVFQRPALEKTRGRTRMARRCAREAER